MPCRSLLRGTILPALFLISCNEDGRSESVGDTVSAPVEWADFLGRNDPAWERLSDKWEDGAFIGNGLLGAMIYKESPRVLRWQLGRTDVISHDQLPGIDWSVPRLPIGDILLTPVGRVISENLRLDLWNAEVMGTVTTDRGEISFRSFVHAVEPLIVIELRTTRDESGAVVSFQPEHGISPRIVWEGKRVEASSLPPMPVTDKVDDVEVTVQPLRGSGEYATAWKSIKLAADHRLVLITIANTHPENNARAKAVADINRLAAIPLEMLVAAHRMFWHAYYPASFVSLPDPVLESFYWIQMYKHASATRPGGIVIDNQGPWLTRTGWPGTWWNLNVQLSYSPVYTANRLEQGKSLCDTLYKFRDNLAANVPPIYRQEEGDFYHLERYSTYDLSGGPRIPFVHELGNLTWALHNCWRQYRYSMDDKMLHSELYPLLRGSINLYLKLLKEGEDGMLHLPPTHSPEFKDPAVFPDANYALGLLRWGLETLLHITTHLRIEDELRPRWQETLGRLADFPQDENGLMIGRGQPLDAGHRHYSHLISIFPLFVLEPNNSEDFPLIERSFQHWLDLGAGTANFNGYSYTAASSIYSVLGQGDRALDMLNSAMNMFSPSTMYLEGSPVIETPFSAAESIHNMLLQSRNGVIRVFPAVPDMWQEVSFHDLRAEGAFLVSGIRMDGHTRMVRIKSLAGEACRLKTDLGKPIHSIAPATFAMREVENGILELNLRKGEEVVMYPGAEQSELQVLPVAVSPDRERYNPFGLKE